MIHAPTPLWAWIKYISDDVSVSPENVTGLFRVLMRTGCDTVRALNHVNRIYTPLTYCLSALYSHHADVVFKLLIDQPNIVVGLARCDHVVDPASGKRCGRVLRGWSDHRGMRLRSALHCTGLARDLPFWVLTDPTKPFLKRLLDDEFDYCANGACDGDHKSASMDKLTFPNPLLGSNYFGDQRREWFATHLPSDRLNEMDSRGFTPLMNAIFYNEPLTVSALLSRVPDVDLTIRSRSSKFTAVDMPLFLTKAKRFTMRFPALFEELREKTALFGIEYFAKARIAISKCLQSPTTYVERNNRVWFPNELVYLVFSYANFPTACS